MLNEVRDSAGILAIWHFEVLDDRPEVGSPLPGAIGGRTISSRCNWPQALPHILENWWAGDEPCLVVAPVVLFWRKQERTNPRITRTQDSGGASCTGRRLKNRENGIRVCLYFVSI